MILGESDDWCEVEESEKVQLQARPESSRPEAEPSLGDPDEIVSEIWGSREG